jgi:hypothetical protein
MGGFFAILTAVLHGATAWRYGYFRDELYFIACSKHMAWGYVDQPPLVVMAAWLSGLAGYNLIALRMLPILAAAYAVFLAITLSHELGAGRFSRAIAAVATMLAPAYLLLGSTLTTTSLEPATWTLVIYSFVRIVSNAGRQDVKAEQFWWLGLAGSIAIGIYAKYSIALLVVGLLIGLFATRERRIVRGPWPLLAALIVAIATLPNAWWQASHGWPIFEVLRGDVAHRHAFQNGVALETPNFISNVWPFITEQFLYVNPIAAPLWIAGLIGPFAVKSLRDLRFVSIAYAFVFVAAVLFSAKGYYIVGMYVALFAIGAAVIEQAALTIRIPYFAALLASGIVAMPLSLPLLPVDDLVAYTARLGLTGRDGTPARLIQPVFAEEFGWGRLARDVAFVYESLPPDVRKRTAIYADTYGDAGALDFFGPHFGLPPAISSQNNYFLWGTRGYDGRVLIAVGATRIDLLRKYYRSVTLERTSTEPYKWVVEGPAPIYLCRDPVAPLDRIWPQLRWYGA